LSCLIEKRLTERRSLKGEDFNVRKVWGTERGVKGSQCWRSALNKEILEALPENKEIKAMSNKKRVRTLNHEGSEEG